MMNFMYCVFSFSGDGGGFYFLELHAGSVRTGAAELEYNVGHKSFDFRVGRKRRGRGEGGSLEWTMCVFGQH